MGLFSLISRKFGSIKNQQPQPRAPPYERKPSARSPVRLVKTISPSDEVASTPVTRGLQDDHTRQAVSRRPGTSSGLSLLSPLELLKPSRPKTASQAFQDPKEPQEPQAAQVSQVSQSPQGAFTSGSHSSTINTRRRTSSIKTESGLRNHVDILDAHSAFTPADFRGRIKASGVREYGEDVADRNIAVSNDADCDLVPDMHTRDERRRMSRPLTASAILDDENDSDCDRFMKQLSMDSAFWSRQGNASRNYRLSQTHCSGNLPARPATSRSANRRTLGALPSFETNSTSGSREHTKHHIRRRSLHNGSVYNNTPKIQFSGDEAERFDLPRWDSSSSEGDDDTETVPRFSVNNQPILSPQPTSFHLSAAMADLTFRAPRGRTSIRHSHKSSWYQDIMEDRQSAPSPSIKLRRSISPIREANTDGSRTRSSTTTPPPISALVPERSSSARKVPTSSTALTAADSPSVAFARPQSHHTTRTSADLGSISMPPMINPSISSVGTENEDLLLEALAESLVNRKSNKANSQFTAFNLDYYVSDNDDDNDSFIESQRDRDRGEKDLAFGGYGENGQQLPGLDDSFSAPAPVVMFRKPRMNTFSSFEDLGRTASADTPFVKHDYEQATNNDVLSLAMELCQDEYSDPEESSSVTAAGSEEKRKSVISSDNGHEKIDVASAVRLRKEVKSRKRASLVSIRSSRVSRFFGINDASKMTGAHQERIDENV